MKLDISAEIHKLIETFEKNGFEIYIVGGAVRDILMGKLVYDWDFTTNATPEEMLTMLPEAFYDNKFGTVGLPPQTEGERPFEITTFRTEQGYSDSRRPDSIKWGKSLDEDLQRRDFTINAMALKRNGEEFEIIDLYGGKDDMEKKLIRTVGEPDERFSEDALRMMRAIRIASEIGFSIEEKTFNAIKKNAASINKISSERVRDELLKTLKSPLPYEGMIMFRDSGLMEEVLPELFKAFGVEQKSPGRHHIYDVGTHCLMSLKHVSEKNPDPIVRFATMVHDIGKPQTFKKLDTGTITFYNHEIVGGKIAKNIAARLKFSKAQSEKFYKLVRFHQFTVDERQTDSAVRRFIRKVGAENLDDMLDLRVGDRLGGGSRETSWRLEEFKKRLIEVQKQPFRVQDIKVTGFDVMKELGIEPGPKVGEVLQSLYDKVVENDLPNDREELLKYLRQKN